MPPELDDDHVVAICQVPADHRVEYVIIGGVAARLHQTGHVTVDVDICPSRTEANRARLATALHALGARLRAEGKPNAVALPSASGLARAGDDHDPHHAPWTTRSVFAPAGFAGGYDDLVARSVVITAADTPLPVASLEDVVASKRAGGRPKDIVGLPALEAHLRRRPPPT
jgi:hypothetical protein